MEFVLYSEFLFFVYKSFALSEFIACSMKKRKRDKTGRLVSAGMKKMTGLKLTKDLPARKATRAESRIQRRYLGSISMLETNFTGVSLERNVCGQRNSAIIAYDVLHAILSIIRINLRLFLWTRLDCVMWNYRLLILGMENRSGDTDFFILGLRRCEL
jgi:hypothetical protein